jgi:hypothetical protein
MQVYWNNCRHQFFEYPEAAQYVLASFLDIENGHLKRIVQNSRLLATCPLKNLKLLLRRILPRTKTLVRVTVYLADNTQTVIVEAAETSAPTEAAVAAVGEYKPSRRVRTAPGGPTSDIFGNAVDDGVLATAPRKGETQVRRNALHVESI